MGRSIDNPMWQSVCVASLIGHCEAIIGKGLLPEKYEQSLRILVAETLSAFHMQNHDERNAA